MPNELSIDLESVALKDDEISESYDALAAVKRIFRRELSAIRRGMWEQAMLWDSSWSGTALGIPQPPELPSLDWLDHMPSTAPYMPLLVEREVNTLTDAALTELLRRWARGRSVSELPRLNLCIQSWELLMTSAVEAITLVDTENCGAPVTELTPTQEQDEDIFEEENCTSETPSTPPPGLVSFKSDRPSRPATTGWERDADCVCVRKSITIRRAAKVRGTDDLSH